MEPAMKVTELTATAASTPAYTPDATVPPALRSDLTISHQLFEGRAYVIVKDPLSLKYFRLPIQDYELAALFDGIRNIAEIRAEFVRQHPHAALAQSTDALTRRITAFANELLLGGFLEATAAGVRRQLEIKKGRVQHTSPWGLFMKALFLKIPLWDPDRLLIHLERRMRWIWSWTGMFISFVIFLAGAAVFAFNIERIAPSLNDFLTLPNLALVWVLTIVVKIIHEFGHGLTCKHYGGEVHEMGAMIIVFSPFLYADVTDSYLFPNRRHRVLVAAAGIYIELVIAAIATLLWAVSQPGPTQQLLFNLMLITSVWTVLFNANPLMKFDGYYILTDLAGVPNLRAKAQRCTGDMFRRFLFGKDAPGQAPPNMLPRRGFSWFVIYSLAAQFYLLYVTLSIAAIFHHLLLPYGLNWLGDWIGVGALVSMLVVPIMSFFKKQLALPAETATAGSSRRRPGIILALVVIFTGALLACPWAMRIERPAAVQAFNLQFVRPEVAGRIETISVRSGEHVNKGDLIARLSSPRISSEVRVAELKLEGAKRERQMMLGADSPSGYKQAENAVAQAENALKEIQRLAAKLELRAAQDGIVITPDLDRLVTGSLRAGDPLCEIAELDPIQIYIPLNERQARHIRAGQRVELRVPGLPGDTFEGKVVEDKKTSPASELPANLVATLGGDIAAAPDAQNRLVPIETTYGVRVELKNPAQALRPGMTGTARIHGDTVPLYRVLWMKVLDFISLDYRL
jgi:putative peptide zinc metalloprotease protein